MKPENRKFLDDNRHHHETLTKAFYLRGLNAHEREGMRRVMSEEFQPGYHTDLWCPPCVAEMVTRLYRCYDEWLAANTSPNIDMSQPSPEPNFVIEEDNAVSEAHHSQLVGDIANGDNIGWVAGEPEDSVIEMADSPEVPEEVAPPAEPPTESVPEEPSVPVPPVQVKANFPSHTEVKSPAPTINNQNHSRKQHRRR